MMRGWMAAVLAVSTASACALSSSGAAEPDRFDAPYCGMYAVYAALRILGNPVEFEELVHPEYIGVRNGSTITEVVRALNDHGVQASALKQMNVRELTQFGKPVILNVRAAQDSEFLLHYVLFLGVENGNALILDPPKSIERMSFAELTRRWEGVAVLTGVAPQRSWQQRMSAYVPLGLIALLACPVLVLLGRSYARVSEGGLLYRSSGRLLLQMAALGLTACAAAGVESSGLFNRYVSYETASSDGYIAPPRVLTIDELKNVLATGNTVLVDARYSVDFNAGHLDGAINIEPTATVDDVARILGKTERGTRIVVYCQSVACPYAARVFRLLREADYRNVAVFPGGWREWMQTGATRPTG